MLYGLLSDLAPICGYRRKGYLVLGNGMSMICLCVLTAAAAGEFLGITLLAWLLFGYSLGKIMRHHNTPHVVYSHLINPTLSSQPLIPTFAAMSCPTPTMLR